MNSQIFEIVIVGSYIIEFQKGGLPHAHLLVWSEQKDRLRSIDIISNSISTKLSNYSDSLICTMLSLNL